MGEWFQWPPSWGMLLLLPALFVGFTVHELAHALVAYLLGDTSQVERKRLSFNPLRHVSWLGLIAFLVVGLGWAKPVRIDHRRFRLQNRAFGVFLVSISGAAANLLLALLGLLGIFGMGLLVSYVRSAPLGEVFAYLLIEEPGPDLQGVAVALSTYMVMVNGMLALFNLIPVPPLDGFQALVSLLYAVRAALGRGPETQGGGVPPRQGWPAAGLGAAGGGQPAAETVQSPAEIHFSIGLDYHRRGELDEAIARYRQATDHDQGFGLAYYNLGLAHWAKGRLTLAMSAFRAVLQVERDPVLGYQAERHLRALERAERDPAAAGAEIGLPPPPLEAPAAAEAPPAEGVPLDPDLVRRLWRRLAVGGVGSLCLAVAAWVFVTVVTLMGVG